MRRARNIPILFHVCNEIGLFPTEIIAKIEKIPRLKKSIYSISYLANAAAVVFGVRLSAQADIIIANKSDNKEI